MEAQYQSGEVLPGTVYRVVRHLATGGMGSVYDVEDVTVGKRYVVKTLHPQLVSRQDLQKRMEVEARTLARLEHPHIVEVVTAGVTRDDKRTPFFVMERLVGQNLRSVLEKKGALDLSYTYQIAIDVLDALEHAHEHGVVHRDVKPENIFLHREPNGQTSTKLLDFGILRLVDRKGTHTHGKFIGTIRYASPEQILGAELGPATDVYSLGLVLYEMVCGRGPFDDLEESAAIGAAHIQKMPPPLSDFARVPEAFEELVLSALAKDPKDRPADCFTFAAELRRLRTGVMRPPDPFVNTEPSAPIVGFAPEDHPALRRVGSDPNVSSRRRPVDSGDPGPLAAEARTRPPERSLFLSVGIVLALFVVAIVVMFVMRPPRGVQARRSAALGSASTTASASAPSPPAAQTNSAPTVKH